jgi:hypothetical protein
VRGKGARLSEGCPKVRLSQDRMPILPPHLALSLSPQSRLGEVESIGILS